MDNNISNLTVVIVTFKTDRSILKNCLDSIDKNVKILIVENSESFNNSKEIENNYSNVKIICSGSNLGMGAGNNFGLQNADTEYVLILNPDIICDKLFFSNIKKYLNDQIDYTIIGSVVNLASRLESIGKSGEIILDKNTYLFAKDNFNINNLGKYNIKGFGKKIDVYKIV